MIGCDMESGILEIATCQFAVNGSVEHNSEKIQMLIREAKDGGADIAHFSECALSGYAGIDFDSFDGYNWHLLRTETEIPFLLTGMNKHFLLGLVRRNLILAFLKR